MICLSDPRLASASAPGHDLPFPRLRASSYHAGKMPLSL